MAHWQFPTTTQMQKAETNKVSLLPNSEYIILLSLPFDGCEGESTEVQVTYMFSTLSSHLKTLPLIAT